MITIGLKLDSGAAQVDIEIIDVMPDFEVIDERYEDVGFVKQRKIHARYKRWTINFAYLDITTQDYLADYAAQEAPQFIHDSVTYDVDITRISARATGGTMVIVNRNPE